MDGLGFIGGGRVTRILLTGLKNAGKLPDTIRVFDTGKEAVEKLKDAFPGVQIVASAEDVFECATVMLALHPPVIATFLQNIKSALRKETILVSLAPKFTIAKMKELLGGFDRLVRVIPNAPSIINAGYNPVSFSEALEENSRQKIRAVFGLLGQFPEVEEQTLEAYAIISAMGPTYFWFQIDELLKTGEQIGLENEALKKAVEEMLKGMIRTYFDSGLDFENVIDLIPVKPIADHEAEIRGIYRSRLVELHNKIAVK